MPGPANQLASMQACTALANAPLAGAVFSGWQQPAWPGMQLKSGACSHGASHARHRQRLTCGPWRGVQHCLYLRGPREPHTLAVHHSQGLHMVQYRQLKAHEVRCLLQSCLRRHCLCSLEPQPTCAGTGLPSLSQAQLQLEAASQGSLQFRQAPAHVQPLNRHIFICAHAA